MPKAAECTDSGGGPSPITNVATKISKLSDTARASHFMAKAIGGRKRIAGIGDSLGTLDTLNTAVSGAQQPQSIRGKAGDSGSPPMENRLVQPRSWIWPQGYGKRSDTGVDLSHVVEGEMPWFRSEKPGEEQTNEDERSTVGC